jgi:nucleoside-diphosphate-sugar epimerase
MRLLVLGGSVFLGRAVVAAALARGDEVTTLNRGLTGSVPAGARALIGDRMADDGLVALAGGEWDVVVDTCQQSPTQVGRSVAALHGRVGRYVYVSSVSVYASFAEGPIHEDTVVLTSADDGADEADPALYGELKMRCEDLVRAGFGNASLVVRPGLVVGPWDPSGRFTYWVDRGARGGRMIAPGLPGRRVEFIDVRDLAAWIVRTDGEGTVNAVGPAGVVTMGELLATCSEVGAGGAALEWISDAFLLDQGVVPYAEMPLWIPDEPEYRYFSEVSAERAIASGLSFRPVRETVADTLAWSRAHPAVDRRNGLSPEREADLLARWDAREG